MRELKLKDDDFEILKFIDIEDKKLFAFCDKKYCSYSTARRLHRRALDAVKILFYYLPKERQKYYAALMEATKNRLK